MTAEAESVRLASGTLGAVEGQNQHAILWHLSNACINNEAGTANLPNRCAAALRPSNAELPLWLTRDSLGAATLYYTRVDDRLLFGTNAAELALQTPQGLRENPDFLRDLFTSGFPATPGATAFQGVHEVLPGELICWDGVSLSRSRTAFDPTLRSRPRTLPQWVEAFLDCFRNAVERCICGEQDLAIMLSGGLDSGPTAALAQAATALGERRFEAVSWSLEEFPECDESIWIRRLAREIGLPLRMFDGSSLLPFSRLSPELMPSDYPSFNVFRELIDGCYSEAREGGFGIVLNAACGDQVYPEASMVAADQFRRGRLVSAAALLMRSVQKNGIRGLSSNPDLRRLAALMLAPLRPVRARRSRPMPAWTPEERRNLATPRLSDWPPELDDHPFPHHAAWLAGPGMFFGTAHESGSMASRYGLERRDPFQDPELIRLMWNLPAILGWKDGKEKWIMREAMRDILPAWHLQKGRTGLLHRFHDRGRIVHRARIQEFLGDQRAVWQDWFQPEFIEAELATNPVDRRGEMALIHCIGYTLWRQKLNQLQRSQPPEA